MKEHFGRYAVVYTFIVLALALVAGFFIGKTETFKSILASIFGKGKGNSTNPPADGTPCSVIQNGAEVAGVYTGGVCTTSGGAGNPSGGGGGSGDGKANSYSSRTTSSSIQEERMAQLRGAGINDTTSRSNLACKKWIEASANDPNLHNYWLACTSGTRTGNAPAIIYLPVSVNCRDYTSSNPYHAFGCSYVFAGYSVQAGKRVCQLNKTSCPW